MLQKIKNQFKEINYKLLIALIIQGLIPTLYTTLRIFFLGQLPDSYSFSIASQLQWLNLFYEVTQEAFILPLYYFIGQSFLKNINKDSKIENDNCINNKDLTNRVKTGLIIGFSLYAIVSLFIIILASPLTKFMKQDPSLIEQTVLFIRLESISKIFIILVDFITVVLVMLNKSKYLYFILVIKMILTIILDTFFVSTLKISLNLGVNGIALTNILVSLILLIVVIFILNKEKIKIFSKGKLSFLWVKDLFKKGGISGLESFVRNLAFMLMIVRMVNIVGEQGTFWVANNFIWGWLLLPILSLGELVKRDCGEKSFENVKEKSLGYFLLTTIFVVIWIISIPTWKPFLKNVMQLSNYEEVFFIALISLSFYIFFAYNNVIDSIFYGLGKTNLMLFQSLVINIVYYSLLYILFKANVYKPTLIYISLMFAGGTALDSILTYFLFYKMCKKNKIKFKYN